MHRFRRIPLLCLAVATMAGPFIATLRAGESVPASTRSPDGTLGVTVPDKTTFSEVKYRADGMPEKFLHRVVEVKTGRMLGEIRAPNGLEHGNHSGLSPRWTDDGSGLLWIIHGKWSPRSAVYLQISNGMVAWQTDLLGGTQTEMLRQTRRAAPRTYAAAVEANKGSGSAYPEGFVIDVNFPEANPTLPLRFHACLTSNPKGLVAFPSKAEVFARMTGTLKSDGTLSWTGYQAWTGPAARREHGVSGE
jgi:hypothetical protein